MPHILTTKSVVIAGGCLSLLLLLLPSTNPGGSILLASAQRRGRGGGGGRYGGYGGGGYGGFNGFNAGNFNFDEKKYQKEFEKAQRQYERQAKQNYGGNYKPPNYNGNYNQRDFEKAQREYERQAKEQYGQNYENYKPPKYDGQDFDFGGGGQKSKREPKDEKKYYKYLGVDFDADSKTIKSAHRKLALKYHPDKFKPEPSNTEEKNERLRKKRECGSTSCLNLQSSPDNITSRQTTTGSSRYRPRTTY